MKDGRSVPFVADNLYQLDLKDLPNKQVAASFVEVNASGEVVEQATASPGQKRAAAKRRKAEEPILKAGEGQKRASDVPEVEVSTDEL
jgi:hypothetical protein